MTFLLVSLPSADMTDFDTSTQGNVWPISETYFPHQVILISAAPADTARGSGGVSGREQKRQLKSKGKMIC